MTEYYQKSKWFLHNLFKKHLQNVNFTRELIILHMRCMWCMWQISCLRRAIRPCLTDSLTDKWFLKHLICPFVRKCGLSHWEKEAVGNFFFCDTWMFSCHRYWQFVAAKSLQGKFKLDGPAKICNSRPYSTYIESHQKYSWTSNQGQKAFFYIDFKVEFQKFNLAMLNSSFR